MRDPRRKPRFAHLDAAPLALTSKGEVVANIAYIDDIRSVAAMAKHLPEVRGGLFVGVVLGKRDVRRMLADLDNAAAEIAAVIGGRRGLRRG